MINTNKQKLPQGKTFFDTLNAKSVTKTDIIIDCDGVLTDGNSIYSENGKVYKIYGAYDTEMLKFLEKLGYTIYFVTKDQIGFKITKRRIFDLGFPYNLFSCDNVERANMVKNHVNANDTVIFIGDSLSDIPAMCEATYACCPKNAPDEVKKYVDYIAEKDGGHGALGDILMHIVTTNPTDNTDKQSDEKYL